MANSDRPAGFRPYGRIKSINYGVAAAAIAKGDALKVDSDGKIAVGTAAGALCGVAAAQAASGATVMYYDDPTQLFIGQGDGSDIDAQTDFNLNCDLLATAYNSTYDMSRHEVDTSELNTTATLPLKIIRILNTPENALGAQVKVVFKINNHQYGSHTGTAGV